MYQDYKDLLVWQKAMELTTEVYKLIKLLPKEETFALASQMRRSAVSIPSNIAEGKGRNSDKEYSQFLAIAQGSRCELETQLLLCVNLGYLTNEHICYSIQLSNEVGKMLTKLILSLKK